MQGCFVWKAVEAGAMIDVAPCTLAWFRDLWRDCPNPQLQGCAAAPFAALHLSDVCLHGTYALPLHAQRSQLMLSLCRCSCCFTHCQH